MPLTTVHGMNAFECLSAMQKCIRRALEREAMEFAVELGHTSRNLAAMVCNRMQIISHEDIGLADPFVQVYVRLACEQAMSWYDPAKLGKWRMPVGNAMRLMCRSAKSRESDHFQAAVGLRSVMDGHVPTVPDCAYDMHTQKGRSMGRSLEHFLTEGAKLVPPCAEEDKYEDEAAEFWRRKMGGESATPRPVKRTSDGPMLWNDDQPDEEGNT